MITIELIENFRETVIPCVSNLLFNVNYEGMGQQDKDEFERDFNEILDLAQVALDLERRTDETRRCNMDS